MESNPEVMSSYMKSLGFPTHIADFYDLMALEDWALQMIPQPVVALLLNFSINENIEKAFEEA